MRASYLALCGLLLTVVFSAAIAEPQALITVDPNNFAPGHHISKATAGAELLALFFVPNPQLPGISMPQYSKVYAQSVTPDCMLLDTLPCAPIGSNVLGYSPVSTPSGTPINWGEADLAFFCLSLNQCSSVDLASLETIPALRVNFDTPTNYVTALSALREDGGIIYAFAFNSVGQFVGYCTGVPGVPTNLPGCTATLFSGSDPQPSWVRYTLSDPNSEISFVIIGGANTVRPIAQVQFNSPVSVQLAGLLKRVKDVGPGNKLERAVRFAQTYYAVPDIEATCATLAGFDADVKKFTGGDDDDGSHIGKREASRLLATTQAIEVALNCH